ncbi:hypothetical protein J4E90_001645 [Alternaria incomplexa]|uniref:uncharacterized protein n=1 Tax=Alternaria incomplexa TaxID=1187928 RepID=UPI00221FD33B|nr:uncharacterized protein J4E90_001645 [Alternaria incomplexa]KAI4919510.1 hypothetical protein J4E90_001645 [Alternaria incomplexa]
MELLDLPPEIFEKVIESYVHTVGVCKAWKRRKVCKTFAAFISEEYTAKTKLNKALDEVTWAAVASWHWDTAIVLIDWWFQHCRKPQPPTIVAWANQAVGAQATDFLHRLLDHKLSLATRNLLIKRLYGPNLYPSGIDNQDSFIEASIGRNLMDLRGAYICGRPGEFSASLLALAARKGDIKIAKKCLEWGMSSNGLRSYTDRFEHPLVNAVARSDKAMVKLLLAHDADPEPAHDHIVRFGRKREGRGKISKKIAKRIQKAVDRKKAKAITGA